MRKVIILFAVIFAMLIGCTEATENSESNNTTQNENNNQSSGGNNQGNNNNQGGNNVTPQVSYKVNFNTENLSWDTVYVFAWDGDANNGIWPGVKMSTTGDGWYSATVNYSNLIFNNGSDQQTVDLKSQNGYFIPESTNSSGKITGTWYTSNYTVNFYAGNSGWDTVYVFAWDGTDTNAKWPGVEMSAADDGWYNATVNYSNLIFNNGDDQQTIDLESQNGYFIPENVDEDGKIIGTWYTSNYTVNFYAGNSGWDTVYVFAWDGTDTNAKWPGVEMSVAGDGWYGANINYPNLIFNNGDDQQTIDLKSQNGYFVPENVDEDGMIIGTWYTSKPTSNNGSDSIYGKWVDKDLDLVYTINKDGTYSIIQGGILIESGTFEEENVNSRAAKKSVNIKSIAKTSGGAKKTTKSPKVTEKTIAKSTENETIFIGNTSLVQEDSLSVSKTDKFYVYAQSDVVPEVFLYSNEDVRAEAKISDVSSATKIGGISYRWYKFVIENANSISISEGENSDWLDRIFCNPDLPYCIYYGSQGEYVTLGSKPDNIFPDEDYAGRDNLYYIRGNFEAGVDQYLATDGFNNMEEIEENIFKGTLYLTENVYGFKVSTADWEYDYCVSYEMGFIPKNEWFNVVRGEYSEWHGKNAALSTAGGMYTFILDLTDSENPQMMISSDEEDYEISNEDSALYVLGSFNDWKYDSSNGIMTEISTGTYEGIINVTTTGLCEFKIADKAWGGIIDDIGFSWWNDASREIFLDTPTVVDGAYTSDPKGSTENIVIDFAETGNYKVSLEKGNGIYILTVSMQ